jgi:hypothetical protein
MSILDNPLDVAFAVSIYTNLDGGNRSCKTFPKFLGDYALLSVDQEGIVATTEDSQERLECLAWAVGQS